MSDSDHNQTDSCSTTPGTILRRCREFRGLSLREAAESTKVAEQYLAALEQDRVRDFANQAYLIGFMRIYSDFLGLNPDDMIRLCERQYGVAADGDSGQGVRNWLFGGVRRPFPWKKLLLPAVLLLLMIVTSSLLDHAPAPRRTSPLPPPVRTVAAPVAVIQPARSSAMPESSSVEAIAVSETEASRNRDEAQPETEAPREEVDTETSRGVRVRLKVIRNASLAVTMDGTTTQYYELTSGDTFEWKAERTVALELSDAGSVAVDLNGRPLGSLGSGGVPAYIVLDATGIRPQ